MFIIKSYIQYPQKLIRDFKKVRKDPGYYFIEISNLEEILHIKKDLDFDYIYGVLFFSYKDQIVIDFTDYDLIDQLWAYFLNMIEDFLVINMAEMSFPDQPLPMSMKNTADQHILFTINYVEWKLPKYEFLEALLLGAKDFFEKMILLIEEKKHNWIFELRRIKKLEQQINVLKDNVYN